MSVYPQIIIEIYTTEWIDISSDVIGEISGNYGIMSNGKLDRVADTGELNFVLNNSDTSIGGVEHYYSPNLVNCLSGFRKGIYVRLKIYYEPDSLVKWYGHINSININVNEKRVEVNCLDYFDYFINHKLNLSNVSTDKKIGETVDLILTGMNIQPNAKTHLTSQDTFSTIFDTIKDGTRATTELQKLALSEFGWIYLRHGTVPETLVTEGRHSRNFQSNLTKIPLNGEHLLLEDGGYFLLEDGSRLMLNVLQDASFNSNMVETELGYGDNLINRIKVKTYPRTVDTTNQVLYSIPEAITLNAGQTKSFIGVYRDPLQKAQTVAGKSMVTPVSGSANDFCMYSTPITGSGINLTADLSVSASYSATTVSFTVENTSVTDGYITKLQSRGLGIYIYTNLNFENEDEDSIDDYGVQELDIDMKYQSSPFVAEAIAEITVSQYKDPKTFPNKVSFLANTNDLLLISFMYIEPGSLVYIQDEKTDVNSYHYINGIEFTILPGGIIYFTWILTDALSLDDTYWILGTSQLGYSTILSY